MTTQWAFAHKAEQRSLARQARCNRAHSAVTQKVIVDEEGKVTIHAAFLMFASGQLRFLGLKTGLNFRSEAQEQAHSGFSVECLNSSPISGGDFDD